MLRSRLLLLAAFLLCSLAMSVTAADNAPLPTFDLAGVRCRISTHMESNSAMSYEGVLKSADKKTVVLTVERTRAMKIHKIPIVGDVLVAHDWARVDRHDVTLPFESVQDIALLNKQATGATKEK